MVCGGTHTSQILVANTDGHSVLTSKYYMPTYVHKKSSHYDTQTYDIYIYIAIKYILSNTLHILNTTYILFQSHHSLSFPVPCPTLFATPIPLVSHPCAALWISFRG